MKAKDLSAQLASRVESIVAELLPKGKRAGNYWQAGDAFGSAGSSLYVHLSGQWRGNWRDAATGERGDLIDLIALQRGASLGEAMAIAAQMIGQEQRRDNFKPVEEQKPRDNVKAASGLWQRARPLTTSYGQHGQAYLQGRGLSLHNIFDLRFLKNAWVMVDGSRREFPAIIAAVRGESGEVVGVHRTFLDPTTPAKAPIKDPKRALGHLTGGACWLRRSGECLIVAEGIETALSIGMVFPGAALAAGLTAHHLAEMNIPRNYSRILIAADNDEAGQNAAARLTERVKEGRECVATAVSQFGDFNDDLNRLGLAEMRRKVKAMVKQQTR